MTWPFRRKRAPLLDPWDLSTPVLQWAPGCPFTTGDACQGVGIFGSTGAGKSTGSFATILKSYLLAGWGGVLFTAKPEDTLQYAKLVRDAGRQDDLLVFSPEHALRYNFIEEELRRSGDGAGVVENLSALVLTVVELLERSKDRGGGEQFFRLESTRLLRNTILVLLLAKRHFTMTDLHRLIVSAPQSIEEFENKSWQESSMCFQCLRQAQDTPKNESMRADFDLAVTYFAREWPALASRTRSSVQVTLTSATDLLSRGLVRDMLSAPRSTFSASMLHDGAILIAAFPVLRHALAGQMIQVILKHALQRDHVRRDVSRNPRPTFMAADEAQLLWVDADQEFQGVTRSTRTAVVYATQGLSTMLDAFGPNSDDKVHSLLGSLQCRISHQQTDIRTVEYMQQLIGRSRQLLLSGNSSRDGDWLGPLFGERSGGSAGFSEHLDFELQARDLNSLAKGGPPAWFTEAIVYQGGKVFPNGRTWLRAAFPQHR
ncbi:MAG: type IV secretory system conjugative DNA transfer family protein [Phycisphaerales bacterium]